MDCGWVKLHRSVFESPDFHSPAERYAFLWLVAHAAWQPCEVRTYHRRSVRLERGQITASTRYLAEQWGMSKSGVSRFLDHLEKRDTIRRERGTAAGAGRMVITICNYEKFQAVEAHAGQPVGQNRDTDRDKTGTRPGHNNEEGKKLRREEYTPQPPQGGSRRGEGYSDEFEAMWRHWRATLELEPGGKGAAWKAWRKLTGRQRALCRPAAERYAAEVAAKQRTRKDGWNGAHFSTWLNSGFIDTYAEDVEDGEGHSDVGRWIGQAADEDRSVDSGDLRERGGKLDQSNRPVRDAGPTQPGRQSRVGGVAPVLSPPQSPVGLDYEEGGERTVELRQVCGSDTVPMGIDRRSTVRALSEFLSELDPDAEHLASAPSRVGGGPSPGGWRH